MPIFPETPAASTLSPADLAKRAAAAAAVNLVTDGMRLGLGSGSTSAWFVRLLGAHLRETGIAVEGVPTSNDTARLAGDLGIPLIRLEDVEALDLTVDGADEFDPALDLIKGGGAALLREKIVAAASRRLVILTDASKRVPRLGAFPLPVEVVRFGWPNTRRAIEEVLARFGLEGAPVAIRPGAEGPLVTDEGHHILDLRLGAIPDAPGLAAALGAIPGVVEHGLFIGMADCVILGRADGSVETLRRIETADAPLDIDAEMRDEDA